MRRARKQQNSLELFEDCSRIIANLVLSERGAIVFELEAATPCMSLISFEASLFLSSDF
jgi:hypothetical protein